MNDFDLGEFLVREMKDLNKKIDDNQKETSENITELRTCMYQKIDGVKTDVNNKVDEIKTDVNKKFSDHAQLHLNNAKSYISTKIFVVALVFIIGSIGTISLLANNNRNDITEIKAKNQVVEKVEADEKRLPDKNENK